MATEGGGSEEGKGYHFACSLTELQQLGRKRVTVEERVVVLFHVKGQVYALDHFCYRKLRHKALALVVFRHTNVIVVMCHRRWRPTGVRRH